MNRSKSFLALGVIGVSLMLMATANAPRFQEQTLYAGPPSFNLGTARQLQRWGATVVPAASIPTQLGSDVTLILGACPGSLGIAPTRLLNWLNQGVMLVSMDCNDGELFAAAGGVDRVVGDWQAQSHSSVSPTARSTGQTWWTAAIARNATIQAKWSFLGLRNKSLVSGDGQTLDQLLVLDEHPSQSK